MYVILEKELRRVTATCVLSVFTDVGAVMHSNIF